MASFDNLVNSLSNNSSNPTTPTPVQGPLISDLARAQIANANPNTQQAIDAVQQAQDMQRYIGMDNHVQDYALNGIAAAADAVGSLGALGGEAGERAADATLGNVARGLRSLTSSDSQHRQELKANTGAWLQAKSQAQYQKDIANGKSQTEASLAKIGRDAVNFFNSNDLGMVTAESAGSLVGSFIGGGLLGKVASLGAKGIMAANAAKTIVGKAATYEKTIAELSQVRAEAQAAAQAGKISVDEATATIQKIDADVAKLSAQKEGILADQAALAEQQQAVMQAQDLNKARQGYIENQVSNEALSVPSKEVLDTEAKTLNNSFDKLVNYRDTNNKRLADTNYNITTTASQKPVQEAKYNIAQKQYAEAVTKANEAESKLTKTEFDFDKFKQNIPEIEAKLNKQIEAKANKAGEEVGGVGINFAYGADAGADAVKNMHLENLSEADLQNSKEYKAKKQEYLNKGLSPEDASAKAIADIRSSIERTTRLGVGAWEAAVSKIMGTTKLEGKGIQGLLRTKPIHMAADTFKETAEEIGQGIGETVGGNISEKRIDNDKDLTEGLGESIAENAFGIPAGMAATKTGALATKAALGTAKLGTAAGATAGILASNAIKEHGSEKAIKQVIEPTGDIKKDSKAFDKLKPEVQNIIQRDAELDNTFINNPDVSFSPEFKEQLTNPNVKSVHQQIHIMHDAAKKEADILNSKDSTKEAKDAAYDKLTEIIGSLGGITNNLNDKIVKSNLSTNEKALLQYSFNKKARELIDNSPEYRERLLKDINDENNSEEDKQNLLKSYALVDLVIDSNIQDKLKNNEDITNEINTLQKVVTDLDDTPSFAHDPRVQAINDKLQAYRQFNAVLQNQVNNIEHWVNTNKSYYKDYAQASNTEQKTLLSKMLNDGKDMFGNEQLSLKGYFVKAMQIMSSNAEDADKAASLQKHLADLHHYINSQDAKVLGMEEASQAYEQTKVQQPVFINGKKSSNYFDGHSYGFLAKLKAENDLMRSSYNILSGAVKYMLPEDSVKPLQTTGSAEPTTSQQQSQQSNSLANNIKPVSGMSAENKQTIQENTQVSPTRVRTGATTFKHNETTFKPIKIYMKGKQYELQPHTEWTSTNSLGLQTGPQAYKVMTGLWKALADPTEANYEELGNALTEKQVNIKLSNLFQINPEHKLGKLRLVPRDIKTNLSKMTEADAKKQKIIVGQAAASLMRSLMTKSSVINWNSSSVGQQNLRNALGIKGSEFNYSVIGYQNLDTITGKTNNQLGDSLGQEMMHIGSDLSWAGGTLYATSTPGIARFTALGASSVGKNSVVMTPNYLLLKNQKVSPEEYKQKANDRYSVLGTGFKDKPINLVIAMIPNGSLGIKGPIAQTINAVQYQNQNNPKALTHVVNLYNHPELFHLVGDDFYNRLAEIISAQQTAQDVSNEFNNSLSHPEFIHRYYSTNIQNRVQQEQKPVDKPVNKPVESKPVQQVQQNQQSQEVPANSTNSVNPTETFVSPIDTLNNLINTYRNQKKEDIDKLKLTEIARIIRELSKAERNYPANTAFPTEEFESILVPLLNAYFNKMDRTTTKSESIKDLRDKAVRHALDMYQQGLPIPDYMLELINRFAPLELQYNNEVVEQSQEDDESSAGQTSIPELSEEVKKAKEEQLKVFVDSEGKPKELDSIQLTDELDNLLNDSNLSEEELVSKINTQLKGRVTILQTVDTNMNSIKSVKQDTNHVLDKIKNQAVKITDSLLEKANDLMKDSGTTYDFLKSPLAPYFRLTSLHTVEWAKDINGKSIESALQSAYVYAMLSAGTRTYSSLRSLYKEGNDNFADLRVNADNEDLAVILDDKNYEHNFITSNNLNQAMSSAIKAFIPALYNNSVPESFAYGASNSLAASLVSSSVTNPASSTQARPATLDEFKLNTFTGNQGNYVVQAGYINVDIIDNTNTETKSRFFNMPYNTKMYLDTVNDINKALLKNGSDAFDSVVLTDEEASQIDDAPLSGHLNHHAEAPLTSLQQKAIKADRTQKHTVTTFGKLISILNPQTYINACLLAIDKADYANKHVTDSIKSKKEALLRGVEYIKTRNQQLDSTDKGLYYNHEMTSISRMNSSDYMSPRNNKEVRESLSPISYKVPTETTRRNLWFRMVLQGLGVKVQNFNDSQVLTKLQQLDTLFDSSPIFKEYAQLNEKLLTKDGLTDKEALRLNELFTKVNNALDELYDEDAHTSLGIHAYTDYFRFKINPNITSSLYGEADGITNGIFFSKIMDGSLAFILQGTSDLDTALTEIDNLARVGFFIGISSSSFYKDAVQKINDKLIQTDGKVEDTYTKVANDYSKTLNSNNGLLSKEGIVKNLYLSDEDSHSNLPEQLVTALKALLPYIGVPLKNSLYEASRSFAKKPVTKANYQAQERSIAVELSRLLATVMEQKLQGYPIKNRKEPISWFDYAKYGTKADSFEFVEESDKEKYKQDCALYNAVKTLSALKVGYIKKNGELVPSTFKPKRFNFKYKNSNGYEVKDVNNINVFNDLFTQTYTLTDKDTGKTKLVTKYPFIDALKAGLVVQLKSVIDTNLGDSVQDSTGKMSLASNYICSVFKSMLAKKLADAISEILTKQGIAVPDPIKYKDIVDGIPDLDATLVDLTARARDLLPRKAYKRILQDAIKQSNAIVYNKSGTKVFNYKQSINADVHSDNDYVINTSKSASTHYTDPVKSFDNPGVAVAPTSTISIGDGETMNRFIVEVLKPLGISYNDVFDGLNMDPDSHVLVGSELNKIAAEQALNNSPIEIISEALNNVINNVSEKDLLINDDSFIDINNYSEWEDLNGENNLPVSMTDKDNLFLLQSALSSKAQAIKNLNQVIKSHYLPYACCQYAFSPNGGYAKKAWIKVKEGDTEVVKQIRDFNDTSLIPEYIRLVSRYLNDKTELNKQDIINYLSKNNLLEEKFNYDRYKTVKDNKTVLDTNSVQQDLANEFARQTNLHTTESPLWQSIDLGDAANHIKGWLKKMCRRLGTITDVAIITNPDLAYSAYRMYQQNYPKAPTCDFTNNAVTLVLPTVTGNHLFILNPYNVKYSTHELTHAIADGILRDKLNNLSYQDKLELQDWLLNKSNVVGKGKNKEPNIINELTKTEPEFANLLKTLKGYIKEYVVIKGDYGEFSSYTHDLPMLVKEAFAQCIASADNNLNKAAKKTLKANSTIYKAFMYALNNLKEAFLKFFGLSSDKQLIDIFGKEMYPTYRNAAMVFFTQTVMNKEYNQESSLVADSKPSFAVMPKESITTDRLNAFIEQKKQDPKFMNLVSAYSYSESNLGDVATDYATSGLDAVADLPFITSLDTIIKGNYLPSNVSLKLNKLYSEFLNSKELNSISSEKQALLTGNILDINENHKSFTSGLTNFIYMGIKDPEVNKVLKSMKQTKLNKVNTNYAVDDFLINTVNDAYNSLVLDKDNIADVIEASLAKGIASQAVLNNINNLFRKESFAESKLNHLAVTAEIKSMGLIGKAVDTVETKLNSPIKAGKALQSLAVLAKTDAGKQAYEHGLVSKLTQDYASLLPSKSYLKPIQEIIREFTGMNFHNFPVYSLLKKATATLDRESLQRSKGIPDLLRKKFKNITKEDEAMLAKHYLKLDLTTLLDGSNIYELANIIRDPSSEITQYEQGLTGYQISKAKQLANYMVTGKSRGLLLRNAHAIAASKNNLIDDLNYAENTVPQIDKLVSCYAVQLLKDDERDKLATFIENNKTGMDALADIHNSIKQAELNKLSNKFNYYKGYIPLQFKNQVNYKAVYSMEAVKEAQHRGWDLVQKLPKTGNAGEVYIMRTSLPDVNFHKGIIQNESIKIYGTNERGLSTSTIIKPLTRDQYSYDPFNISSYEPIPTFSSTGKVYYYDRPTPLPDSVYDWSGLDALGKWSANEFIESASKSFNVEAVALTKKVYDEDAKFYGSNTSKFYVDINEEAKKDRVVKDAWDRVDPAIKSAIAKNFGGKALVRKDMLDLFIGYRSASITDIYTGNSRMPAKALNTAAKLADVLLGRNAYKILGHAERAIQYTTSTARNYIVVRSCVIPFNNIVSNIIQLRMRGIPYSEIAKGIRTKTMELEEYRHIEKQNIQLKSKLITAKSRQERQKLENRLENNLQRIKTMSIYPMIKAGELSSLADVGDEYNDSIFTGKWADKINEEVAKIPEPIVKAGKWLSVSKDTGLYKLMEKATIYGDFISKSIYFDKLLGDGVKLENAQRMAMEEFVNYDMMAGRTREYLENMGIIWFYNYKLRISKIAMDIFLHNPASWIFGELITPQWALDKGTVLADNFFSKAASGGLGSTFMPLNFFFAFWNKNPAVELYKAL
jgi:hypothetical protein